MPRSSFFLLAAITFLFAGPLMAQEEMSFEDLNDKYDVLNANSHTDTYSFRDMIVHVPPKLAPEGQRPLVIALHGGGGSAYFMQNNLDFDATADKYGIVVAYLNGGQVGRFFPPKMRAWNAGGECCGLPARRGTDDIGYVTGAIDYLVDKYGIDRKKVFGIGHSNGAMMLQLIMCRTGAFTAVIPIAGPLNEPTEQSCPAAKGKSILALHGGSDMNVPIGGGKADQGANMITYQSQDFSKKIFTESGATYIFEKISGASHKLADIGALIQEQQGISFGEKAARFFGLAK